ncbi:hypothetical protein PSENEW3_00006182 [Picochlorum sp. SENEW3]|nr:hypothetical protein PSENEW3_00006182 [Picochlorum sp. SENEW3]
MAKDGVNSGAKGGPNPSGSAAAKSGAATGIGAWWQNFTKSPKGEAVKSRMSSFTTMAKEKASKMKLAMPVDVKVDFLQPTIQTVRGAFDSAWQQLPPQAQQAAPYVGVAFGSGLVVYLIQQRRVNYYKKKREGLLAEVKSLQKDKDDLKYKVGVLKAGGGIPRTENEIRMATAIAEATNAAAAAADAAARAATSCIVNIQKPKVAVPRS